MRIYRRIDASAGEPVGTIERVGTGERVGFCDSRELILHLLAADRPSRGTAGPAAKPEETS
ncbi:MAG: hypothetical protein IT518_15945 [Burkholderiales bacterium]|nr:hypothetical protein [Burkholderiales bacterium]